MNSFTAIVLQEVRLLWRDRTFQLLAVLLLLLAGYTIISSTKHYQHAHNDHQHLTDTVRHMFVNQKPTSAHMAGHYGHVVFKPATFLQAIDPGVNPFTGTTVRLEAHRQNEAVFSPASGQSSLVRFGEFSFSLLLQVVFPLLILFSCYRSVVNDRLNGTLKLLVCQGISMRRLITGKAVAYIGVYWMFLLIAAFAYGLFFVSNNDSSQTAEVIPRIALLLSLYGTYYALLIAAAVYFSARAKQPSGLLVGLLAVWFVCTIIIPKSTANIGAQLSPLPTRFALNEEIRGMKQGGIDGHDSRSDRTKQFTDSVLQAYGVDSVQQLPVKIGGLLMQADEDFNNSVYDQALTGISNTIAAQNRIGSLSGFINPFMAIKNLSMAIAGTDMHHHFNFTRDAENYRRMLISNLNTQDAARVSKFKDAKGKMTREYWQQIKDYRYQSPSLAWSLSHCRIEIAALLMWIAGISLIIYFTSNKIQIA